MLGIAVAGAFGENAIGADPGGELFLRVGEDREGLARIVAVEEKRAHRLQNASGEGDLKRLFLGDEFDGVRAADDDHQRIEDRLMVGDVKRRFVLTEPLNVLPFEIEAHVLGEGDDEFPDFGVALLQGIFLRMPGIGNHPSEIGPKDLDEATGEGPDDLQIAFGGFLFRFLSHS